MDYLGYQNLIREIDGKPPQTLAEGVTTKNLDFNERGNEGSAVIYFKYDEPIMVDWYVWNLKNDYFLAQLEKELGGTVRLVGTTGGNGHYRAALEINGKLSDIIK